MLSKAIYANKKKTAQVAKVTVSSIKSTIKNCTNEPFKIKDLQAKLAESFKNNIKVLAGTKRIFTIKDIEEDLTATEVKADLNRQISIECTMLDLRLYYQGTQIARVETRDEVAT